MLKYIFLFLFGCSSALSSYEQLRQEVLNSACNASVRKDLEQAIEGQRQLLSEEQMATSLQKMKEEIQCN